MTNKIWYVLSGLAAVAVVAGCAATSQSADNASLDADFAAMLKSSFRDDGIAKVDRLKQDLPQEACSSDKPPSPEMVKRIEAVELATIVWPAGGQYFGDWKNGEKLAQSGRGMTWSDKTADTKDKRRPVLQLPPARQGGDLLRHHRAQPLQLRQAARRP